MKKILLQDSPAPAASAGPCFPFPSTARALTALVVAFCAAVLCRPAASAADDAQLSGETRVSYVTSKSVYLEAGSENGLKAGDMVDLVRDGTVVAEMKVVELSPIRSVCDRPAATTDVTIGDKVRYRSRTAATAAGAGAQAGAPYDSARSSNNSHSASPGSGAAGSASSISAGGSNQAGGPSGAARSAEALNSAASGSGAAGSPTSGSDSAGSASAGATGGEPQADSEAAAPAAAAPTPAANAAPPPAKDPWSPRDWGLGGRAGLRYQLVRDRSGSDSKFSQPGADLRLDGRQIGGAPFDLDVDIRAYRTYRTLSDGSSEDFSQNRIYRALVAWRPGNSPLRVALGRQFTPALSSLSFYDGLSAQYDAPRWSAGFVTGSQLDPVSYHYSGDIREHGVWGELRSKTDTSRRWDASFGLIGSYDHGEINREFAYLQGLYNDPKLSVFVAQEVDINRGWKKEDTGASTFSSTSTFISARLQAASFLSVNAGYDNRRNVPLWRDHVTPETEFDDTFRRGEWAGVDFRFLKRFGAGVDARRSSGGSAGPADSYSLYLSARDITDSSLGFRARGTHYTNPRLDGNLYSLTVDMPLGSIASVALTGGVRDETSNVMTLQTGRLAWYGLDFDIALARRLFLLLSAERNTGDYEANDQAYAALSYRF